MNRPSFLGVFASALVAISALQTCAANLKFGDIVVAAQSEGTVYGIDPDTGLTTLVSENGHLYNPFHITVDRAGRVLIAERTESVGVVSVNPWDGSQSQLASGAEFDFTVALALDGPHDLIIGNSSYATGKNLYRYNVVTGTVSHIAILNGLINIQDIEVDSEGRIVVLDGGRLFSRDGKIVRYDPSTGLQEVLSVPSASNTPVDLAIDSMGRYVFALRVADVATEFFRFDPVSGNEQRLARAPGGGFFALKDDDSAYFAGGSGMQRFLMEVDLTTGESRTITRLPTNTVGIAIYRPLPEPTSLYMAGIAAAVLLRGGRRR